MSELEQTVPEMDHSAGEAGQTEEQLLAAVMQNSPIMDEVGIPLPEEETAEVDPSEEVEEEVEDPSTEEDVEEEEEVEEEVEETEGEDGAEAPTQDPDVFTADDLDLDAKVRVKVDGEELDVSFADLLKGYQTDASISKKGRELGEMRKALEAEREEALAQVNQLGEASAAVLYRQEQNLSRKYHELEKQIDKARSEDDTYELGKLKDQQDQIQKKYWNARNGRENLVQQVEVQRQEQEQARFAQQLETFNNSIDDHVPGFNEEMAGQIRDFALEEGMDEVVLASILDPVAIKMLNDYRILKQGVSKGVAKRKAVPTKKAVPVKKEKTAKQKAASKENILKARAHREDASQEDQMEFLKSISAARNFS